MREGKNYFKAASAHFLSEFGTKGKVDPKVPRSVTYSQVSKKYCLKVEVLPVSYKEGNSKSALSYLLC